MRKETPETQPSEKMIMVVHVDWLGGSSRSS
jgi:hypothetical protein